MERNLLFHLFVVEEMHVCKVNWFVIKLTTIPFFLALLMILWFSNLRETSSLLDRRIQVSSIFPARYTPIDAAKSGGEPVKSMRSNEIETLETVVQAARRATNRFFLDCGANTGSTYKLFHEIWPDPDEYLMISFDVDTRLRPFYASFENHAAFVPLAVSHEDGFFEVHLESVRQPNENASEMKWGGGTFFSFGASDYRKLKLKVTVPTFDLSKFLSENFREDDEVILKLDIEGSEYKLVEKMLDDGTFKFVDKFYLEFHDWQPIDWSQSQKDALRDRMKAENVYFDEWEAEYPLLPDATKYEPRVLEHFPQIGNCRSKTGGHVKLALAVGMNARRARRLIATVMAHEATIDLKVGLFLYRDFMYENAELVTDWLKDPRFVIGSRGDSPRPRDFFMKMNYALEIDMIVLSSLRQIVRTSGFSTKHFLPDFSGNVHWDRTLEERKLEVAKPTVWVPPRNVSQLDAPFFSKRSVEKIPPLLQAVYKALEKLDQKRPVLVFDSDFDETWISSVFFLDYFVSASAASNHLSLTGFENC